MIRGLMQTNRRSYRWLADETGIPYKHVLHQIKAGDRPLELEYSLRIARVLGVSLVELVEEDEVA